MATAILSPPPLSPAVVFPTTKLPHFVMVIGFKSHERPNFFGRRGGSLLANWEIGGKQWDLHCFVHTKGAHGLSMDLSDGSDPGTKPPLAARRYLRSPPKTGQPAAPMRPEHQAAKPPPSLSSFSSPIRPSSPKLSGSPDAKKQRQRRKPADTRRHPEQQSLSLSPAHSHGVSAVTLALGSYLVFLQSTEFVSSPPPAPRPIRRQRTAATENLTYLYLTLVNTPVKTLKYE